MEKEYVVTLENAEDADQFFAEMTAQSGTGQIPARSVDVVNARPGSLRNTEYALTEAEAEALRSDPRVLAVEIPVHLNPNVKSGPGLTQTGNFSKTTSASGSNINWGLIRCNATSNIYGTGNSTSQDYNYHLDGTGVDIVIADTGIQVGHPEWEDAAGSSRLQQINWYTAAGVSGTQSSSFYTDTDGHGTHVAGIAAGKTFGWARGANIYSMKIGDTGAIPLSGVSYTAFDLIRLWHNAKPVQSNGYKRPTIVNASWQYWYPYGTPPTYINYRGSAKQGTLVDTSAERLAYGWAGDWTPGNFPTGGQYVQPYRDTAVDAEVEDMISAGVIYVHIAGNFGYKTDAPGGPDYDNYAYSSTASNQYRYNQGCSPTGAGNRTNGFGDSIEVGAIDATAYSSSLDQKAWYSNAGPGINIYAPGQNIVSAYSNSASGGSSYYLDSNYTQQIKSGTSQAAPQVAGVAALIAQVNPQITPAEMKEYLVTKFGQTGDIYTSGQNNDFSNSRSLWGGSDVMLYNPFNTPTAYKITNSGSSSGTAPNISGSTSISVIENTSTSTVLATYTASGTTPITWSVTGTDASNFNINSSGQLTFAVSPDYETPADRSQSINVVATNSAGSDSHAVSITVTNDTADDGGAGTAPTVSGSTSISIIENTSTSTVLATYSATGTTPITWSVTGTDASNFSINSNGQLKFAVSPDYETPADRSQSISVVATNSVGSDSHAVSITVTDDTSDNGSGITSFDMGYTAAGQNKTAPSSQRAWCLERDTSYGYTRYAWFKNANANTATRYYWNPASNPNTWLAQANSTHTFTALGTNWLGLADSGTLLCGVDDSGNISIVNKSTGSQVASAFFNENLQGVLWDGTYFWAGSYTTPSRAIRITTGGLLNSSFTLPSPSPVAKANNRSAFYDFNKNYYYFGDTSAAHAYTFNGSSFTFVGQETSTQWTSQEGEYFEQSDGSKYLIAHNGTNLTSLTPV